MTTVRVKLEYTRKVAQTETGVVHVEVDQNATVADAYRAAFNRDFAEYLPRSYEIHEEDWSFNLKETQRGPAKNPS